MAKKAYIRFDNKGKAVPSTLIWSETKPKIGDWEEIDGYKCCVTTTTSTSSTTTTTTTIPPVNITRFYEVGCPPYNWVLAGQTIYGTGTYTYVDGQNVYILEYTNINIGTSSSEQFVTAVGSYTWPVTGLTYSSSGDYNAIITGSCATGGIVEYVLHLTII